MEKVDRQWLQRLANHEVKGSWDDTQTFQRLKKAGYIYYHQDMYSGQWVLTKKGRMEL